MQLSEDFNIHLNQNFSENSNTLFFGGLNPISSFNNLGTLNIFPQMEQNLFSVFNKEDKLFPETNIYNIKSLEKPEKKSDNKFEKNSFSEISFVKKVDNIIMISSDLTIKNFSNFLDHTNNNNDNLIDLRQVTNLSDLSSNCQKKNIFLGKKRKIFKEIYRKNVSVFNFGECDKGSGKLINETLDEIKNGEIKKYFLLEQSESIKKSHKKQINIISRKYNTDNILKKIKSKFLKALKNKINEKLKNAGSKTFFKNLPQAFISTLTKEKNNSILDMTYKEILNKNFIKWKESDLKGINNYLHNKFVLDYLENNKVTFKNLNFNIFNMTYSQLYNEYIQSKEFEIEITNLIKKETLKYIKKYIFKAYNFINYFCKNKM